MTWQDLGNIGEFVSGIAVVFSLVYVAYQIRQNTSQIDQNTRAVRATAVDSSVSHTMMIRNALFTDAEVAALFLKGNGEPETLSEEERLRYRLILFNIVESLANIFQQSRYAGLMESWEAQESVAQRILTPPGGRWFWENYGREFAESFRDEVARICPELPRPRA